MGYKYHRKDWKNPETKDLDFVVFEILENNGPLTAPKIQEIIKKAPYKNNIKNEDGKITTVSNMQIWRILEKLCVSTNRSIEKFAIDGTWGYRVLPQSEKLAEYNGITFRTFFNYGMFQHQQMLRDEFKASDGKKTELDALMQFLGFYVLSGLVSSRLYNKKLRSSWLRPVLDLEKNGLMSGFFEEITHEDKLIDMVTELRKKYPENMDVLSMAVDGSRKVKKIVDKKGEGLEKMFIDKVNEWKEKK
jgi:hypothetical protein